MATVDPVRPVPTSRVLDWPVNVVWMVVELTPWVWLLWMMVHGIAWVIAMVELAFQELVR
jgi:hypothetical protein